MADFYAVLGLTKTATKDDIKKAYRKAALKTHPDRVPPEQKKAAEDAFRAVTAAYEILGDDKNKAQYDKHGVWPPPASSNSTAYKTRQAQPEYKPFGNSAQPPPFFEDGGAAFHAFVFSDPFLLFNMHFGSDAFQAHAFHAAHSHPRHARTPVPMFEGPFMQPQMFPPQFQSFAQAGATASFTQTATGSTAATGTPPNTFRSESTTVSSKDNEDRGWIKESKVTKVTPQGTRETTLKKTAVDGTVYISRLAGDGSIRHYISINGVEKPTDRGAPEIAPTPRVPLSQTQAQVPPSHPRPTTYAAAPQPQPQPASSRHSPSASQPVNSAYDAQAAYARAYPQAPTSTSDPVRRSASRAGHLERSASRAGHHERSASRAGHHERAYRATSPPPPPPVPPKEAKTTSPAAPTNAPYPTAYAQVPTASVPQRAKSPSPRQEAGRTSEREKEKDLRRNHTVPSHVLSSQATAPPMPRPQSPHFYRPRTISEAQNPSPTKANPSAATAQQPRPRYEPVMGAGTRMTDEPTSYVFSDTEAARLRGSSTYKPSRSSNTVPAPQSQPMSQGVPLAAGGIAPPRRSSSRYGHAHSQSMQAPSSTRHHSAPVPQPMSMKDIPITNGLGLGFVPPPSSGLGSNRDSGVSSGPNPPFGGQSRNPSYEEIVYPYGSKPKLSSRSQQPSYAGNPLPNPPTYREPWSAEAQQQARYRQAAV